MARSWCVILSLAMWVFPFVGTGEAAQDSSAAAASAKIVPARKDTAAMTGAVSNKPPSDTLAKQTAAPAKPAVVAASKDTANKAGVPAAAPKQAGSPKKKAVEEDLYEEMLVPEEGVPQPVVAQPAAKKADTAAAKAAAQARRPDTSKAAVSAPVKEAILPVSDTGKAAPAPAAAVQTADTSRKQAAVAKVATPVRIEEAKPINFAKSLKDYKSPKLAMLLSLIIPGLGQAYVKSYVRAGLYLVAEGAIIGASVAYSNIGKKQYDQATAFADRNYSFDKMINYYNSLYTYLDGIVYQNDTQASDKLNGIYFDTLSSTSSSFYKSHKAKSSQYYQTIQSAEYVQGWNDCQPSLSSILNNASPGDPLDPQPGGKYNYTRYDTAEYQYLVQLQDKNGTVTGPYYGYSDSAVAFQSMISKSNDNYKIASNILFILLVNHVVSAIDALISANAYNQQLLGKQTFWNHINLEPNIAGSGINSGPGLALRMQF